MKEFLISSAFAIFLLSFSIWTMLFFSGNTMSDKEKEFFKESVTLKKQCEAPLPRTQQCVLQYIPEQHHEGDK